MTALLDADILQGNAAALSRGVKAHIDCRVNEWRKGQQVTAEMIELALEQIADHCERLRDEIE